MLILREDGINWECGIDVRGVGGGECVVLVEHYALESCTLEISKINFRDVSRPKVGHKEIALPDACSDEVIRSCQVHTLHHGCC